MHKQYICEHAIFFIRDKISIENEASLAQFYKNKVMNKDPWQFCTTSRQIRQPWEHYTWVLNMSPVWRFAFKQKLICTSLIALLLNPSWGFSKFRSNLLFLSFQVPWWGSRRVQCSLQQLECLGFLNDLHNFTHSDVSTWDPWDKCFLHAWAVALQQKPWIQHSWKIGSWRKDDPIVS